MSKSRSPLHENCRYSLYFAPRGKERLLFLGEELGRRHLRFQDKLIGIIGDAGSGKSSLIRGMFPGLELTNNDDAMDMHKIMQVRDLDDNFTNGTTFHLDMRFQLAFTQMHEIVSFVQNAMANDRRVIVEHFNLLYPALQEHADVMIGIGEEIIVVRPTVFGPTPQSMYDMVHMSLKYRKMAHTVEDIAIRLLMDEFGIDHKYFYSSDIKNGFLLRFTKEIDLDFPKLAKRIDERLAECLTVHYHDETNIMLGDRVIHCTGPRLHVRNTSEITGFRLLEQFIRDEKTDTYCLVGLLDHEETNFELLNIFETGEK
ncbi:hypothetical protein LJC23_02905 [Desulfovibrio sp. OttesenSCG-928-I05]|nr:hypothetical protein [Desulfovibrio sp. OttesenSCG-928-I05]